MACIHHTLLILGPAHFLTGHSSNLYSYICTVQLYMGSLIAGMYSFFCTPPHPPAPSPPPTPRPGRGGAAELHLDAIGCCLYGKNFVLIMR